MCLDFAGTRLPITKGRFPHRFKTATNEEGKNSIGGSPESAGKMASRQMRSRGVALWFWRKTRSFCTQINQRVPPNPKRGSSARTPRHLRANMVLPPVPDHHAIWFLFMKRKIALFISTLLPHSSWGPELKWLCNPVLSCHSCVLAWFACPIGVFVHYSGYHLFPLFALGAMLLVGMLVGRLLCGWVCPLGLVPDLLHKIPSHKFVLPDWTAHLKYLVLFLLVFLFPFLWGEQTWLSATGMDC